MAIWDLFSKRERRKKQQGNMISSFAGPPAPNPLLDMLLPSLLYVRLGSVVDEALVEYMDAHGLTLARGYKNDFNGRICFLADQGKLNDADKLHLIRKQRNLLAHQAKQAYTWQVVADAISEAQAELEHLGMVGPRPTYEFFGERSAAKAARRGKGFAQDFRYGLKENGQRAIEIFWEVTFGGDEDESSAATGTS